MSTYSLRKLALNIGESPSNDIVPVSESFTQLRKLAISNWADENRLPMCVTLSLWVVLCDPSYHPCICAARYTPFTSFGSSSSLPSLSILDMNMNSDPSFSHAVPNISSQHSHTLSLPYAISHSPESPVPLNMLQSSSTFHLLSPLSLVTMPPHPILGTELRLSTLIHLPKLKVLRIRDTHLKDPLWCLDVKGHWQTVHH